ncbi:hypothetical protein VP01_576g3 [Puccinia sorghi]|uniref:Uncharacterized protein n=1 Tax=Puccinia sorghi TaxID=27349 RepID=A0A0L6UIB1_9BASI|nr:hypothetical protein VP01_576g3 [Puccinia sorghi]
MWAHTHARAQLCIYSINIHPEPEIQTQLHKSIYINGGLPFASGDPYRARNRSPIPQGQQRCHWYNSCLGHFGKTNAHPIFTNLQPPGFGVAGPPFDPRPIHKLELLKAQPGRGEDARVGRTFNLGGSYVKDPLFYVHTLFTYFMYIFATQSTEIIIFMIIIVKLHEESISEILLQDLTLLKKITYYIYLYAGFWILWSCQGGMHPCICVKEKPHGFMSDWEVNTANTKKFVFQGSLSFHYLGALINQQKYGCTVDLVFHAQTQFFKEFSRDQMKFVMLFYLLHSQWLITQWFNEFMVEFDNSLPFGDVRFCFCIVPNVQNVMGFGFIYISFIHIDCCCGVWFLIFNGSNIFSNL